MSDQRWFICALEEMGELARVRAEADWDLDFGGVAELNQERARPPLLFENVRGYRMPVLTGTTRAESVGSLHPKLRADLVPASVAELPAAMAASRKATE